MAVDERPRVGSGIGECCTTAGHPRDEREQHDQQRTAPVVRREMQRTGVNRESAGNRDDDNNDERGATGGGRQSRCY
jgi:hypothetical protein